MRILFTLLRNLFSVLFWPLRSFVRTRISKQAGRYVRLKLHRPLLSLPPVKPPFTDVLARIRRRPVHDVQTLSALFEQLADDGQRDGLVLHLGSLQAGWSAIGELRRGLLELRRRGKRVVVFLPRGGDERVLYLASAADEVVISPAGGLSLSGFVHQSMYLARLLEKLGVRVQVNAQGPYKTAAETLVLSEMSAGQREQVQTLLDARHRLVADALLPRIAAGSDASALFSEVAFSPVRAQELGLVNHVAYEDGLPGIVGQTDREERWAIDAERYRALRKRPLFMPLRAKDVIAIVSLHGNIRDGSGGFGAAGITLDTATETLRAARRDPHVSAVLLHINSPGGSALVSDLLHHEVERLAAEKPTVAYFADVAASGGYYIAAPAHAIVAAPEAITGSIGVISLKVVAEALLSRAGVTPQAVRTAPHADMYSPTRPLSHEEAVILERESARIYDRFVEVVANGRHMAEDKVRAVAGGRVWSAEDAQLHGLVDRVGAMSVALAVLHERLGVDEEHAPKAVPFSAGKSGQRAIEGPPATGHAGILATLTAELDEIAWLAGQQERVLCYWQCGIAAASPL